MWPTGERRRRHSGEGTRPRRREPHFVRPSCGAKFAESVASGYCCQACVNRAERRRLAAIRAVLEAAGVTFIVENDEGPGVRLRKTHGP
jgi:hypothetical protein